MGAICSSSAPGSGALAVAVLTELERLNALPGRYLILEPSPDLQARQRERLSAQVPHLAERCQWLSTLPARLRGVVLANEVLDAMPVHRFRIGPAGQPLEVFVTDRDGTLGEVAAPVRSPGLAAAVAAIHAKGLARTPGYCSEVNLRLPAWIKALSREPGGRAGVADRLRQSGRRLLPARPHHGHPDVSPAPPGPR